MGALALPIAAVGTVLSIAGNVSAGRAAKALGERENVAKQFEAQQLNKQADLEIASGQRIAEEQRRQIQYASSRALALASASGGATDPTVVKIISDIAGEGQYRSDVAKYGAADSARKLRLQAQGALYEGEMAKLGGQQKRNAYYLNAGGTALSQGASLYSKYGFGNPSDMSGGVSIQEDPYGLQDSASNYYNKPKSYSYLR